MADADIAALQAACVEAETVKSELIALRQSHRESMSKSAFIAYNEASRDEQLAVEAAVTKANRAFTRALNDVRSDAVHDAVNVGTLEEGNKIGSVS